MKLENASAVVTFCEKGAEIASFINKENGLQYMWQGEEAYWTGKNPTLFPMVGNTYTKTYEINGKKYAMKNHGLLRYVDFTCIKANEHLGGTAAERYHLHRERLLHRGEPQAPW